MGIKNLNKYLRNSCPNSIKCISVSDLSGKKIAVDISIYLYKYETEEMLMENMYLMLSIFKYYNITPIFIFDGKPPDEKKALLQKRREDKLDAEQEYTILKNKLSEIDDDSDKQTILNTMDNLKRQFVYINNYKIERVKDLIRAYGATYYDAPGEADELCAMLVIKKKVWACMSEDMDMFVYGCTRVLRYFSLVNHSVVLYYIKGILNELSMTQEDFREICVLSGTDYNINANGNNDDVNLHNTLKYYVKYKENCNNKRLFYEWLKENTNYINDISLLDKIKSIFDLSKNYKKLSIFERIKIIDGPIMNDYIKNIMSDEGFIFV